MLVQDSLPTLVEVSEHDIDYILMTFRIWGVESFSTSASQKEPKKVNINFRLQNRDRGPFGLGAINPHVFRAKGAIFITRSRKISHVGRNNTG